MVLLEWGGNRNDVCIGSRHVRGRCESATFERAPQFFHETWLHDSDFTTVDRLDFFFENVDPGNIEPTIGHHNRCGETDISKPHERYRLLH